MAKKFFVGRNEVSPEGFRYRGLASSRLENMTDAIFGFAITLLVIASQVPTTYVELQVSMYGFLGFIFCIMLLLGLWNNHNNFFLHFGLQDSTTKILNFLFLFVLLFYVYPLKYLFSYLGTAIYMRIKLALGDSSEAMRQVLETVKQSGLSSAQWVDIMVRFGLGLFLMYLFLLLMHVNAYKKREALQLSQKESYIARTFMQAYGLLLFICMLSIATVLVFGGRSAAIAGSIYGLSAVLLPAHKRWRTARMKKLF
ncbi:TMEM175 family protein [uncultured Croceitalea sp.]|uniref:TMEM175 family protein n=1 Tax=uncultured Croceitalea sp. TaxID=1798908 RepID=UPI0033060DC1